VWENNNNIFFTAHSIILISKQFISESIISQNLSSEWSVSTTVHYLLVSGLLTDLVHFSYVMGDTRTALSLSIVLENYNSTIKSSNK